LAAFAAKRPKNTHKEESMTLTTSTIWLRKAQAEKYAIGAFNANTMEQVQAIVMAAQAECAPVIIQVSHNAVTYIGAGNRLAGLRYVAEIGRMAAESVNVPVVLHFDHGKQVDILQALGLGFTSVMFDGSELPFEENVARTRELCEAAHESGACFEAELGEVPRAGVPGMEEGELTDPEQVAEFVERTGVDALAVAVGSVHALKRKEVQLNFVLLDAIRAVVSVPLVLHGSSGVLDESICEGIQRGLCKVNVATQLNGSFTRAVRDYLQAHPDDVDPRKYLNPARHAMAEAVRERMRLFGVSGKAA
jgi:fructose-bisphosphate aldolase, class II